MSSGHFSIRSPFRSTCDHPQIFSGFVLPRVFIFLCFFCVLLCVCLYFFFKPWRCQFICDTSIWVWMSYGIFSPFLWKWYSDLLEFRFQHSWHVSYNKEVQVHLTMKSSSFLYTLKHMLCARYEGGIMKKICSYQSNTCVTLKSLKG